MGFTWRYQDADGAVVSDLPPSATGEQFPTQADAESWLGQSWRELLDDGVDSVTLMGEDSVVYGPMSLRPST